MEKEKQLSNEESLKIITSMITQAKVNIRQGSFHLLFWGWLIFFCSLSEYLLYQFAGYVHSYYVWLFVIPGVLVSMIYGFMTGRRAKLTTYADMLYMWTWMAFLITAVVLFILMMDRMQSFAPFILMLAGLPTFLSGIILKFKPLVIGGIIFWAMSIASNFLGADLANLAMPVAVISGYLVPGYLLKRKTKNGTV